jgi:hypothetical protein
MGDGAGAAGSSSSTILGADVRRSNSPLTVAKGAKAPCVCVCVCVCVSVCVFAVVSSLTVVQYEVVFGIIYLHAQKALTPSRIKVSQFYIKESHFYTE